MLILQALFLWLIISTLMIGGAMLFHRFFPEESPWFGFIIPPLTLVALLNFIEHLAALPSLLVLLPLLLGATVWMTVWRKYFKEPLILPSAVFLGAFAFTFAVRCLRPDIDYTSDGISDLNMINNFSQGQTLPPPDCWMPPLRFEWYYDLQHYAASVVERLLAVKIGVAYNVSHALLSALICVVGAGAAHRISGGKLWVTLAVPFLIESAATGSSAYLYITSFSSYPDLWMAADPSDKMLHPPDANPIWKWLFNDLPAGLAQMSPDDIAKHQTLRLQVPGFWTWRSEYHANASGHLLSALSVLIVAELVHVQKTIWPWVLAVITPIVAVTVSAWALPIAILLCWIALPTAWVCGRRPVSVRAIVPASFIGLTLLWPAFYNVTSSPQIPPIHGIDPQDHVPLVEFLIQWWPILILWICGCICFRSLSFGLRLILIVVPVMLMGIELVTIDSRYNTIEKMWGYTWAVGLIGLFPFVASRAGAAFKIVAILLLLSAFVSLTYFVHDLAQGNWDGAAFHLEGSRYLTANDQKKKMLEAVGQTKHATYLSGKCVYCYNEAPALAVFTGNKSYIAWSWFESLTNYIDQADSREKLDNDFYSGAMTDRLHFLQSNKITGVIIWPDDDLSDDFLANLRKELEPAYDYIDCKDSGDKNAGVFLLQPLPQN
ncbi:MAG TPA: DUF2298 domain-containing protein [Candidatus Methylacidiphilales bacterium]|jgi:hypothetical protein|nr:DUF2298 domain-containing protein [Candidatus Methylacidiphilales bacterium]